MKKLILTLFAAILTISVGAQTIGEAFYIYRNDGQFNAFLRDEVDSIAYSSYDVDSLYNPRRKKSGIQLRTNRKIIVELLGLDDIFPSISNDGLTISYNLGNSTIEGSIYGGDEEIVRKTVKRLEKTMSKKDF